MRFNYFDVEEAEDEQEEEQLQWILGNIKNFEVQQKYYQDPDEEGGVLIDASSEVPDSLDDNEHTASLSWMSDEEDDVVDVALLRQLQQHQRSMRAQFQPKDSNEMILECSQKRVNGCTALATGKQLGITDVPSWPWTCEDCYQDQQQNYYARYARNPFFTEE